MLRKSWPQAAEPVRLEKADGTVQELTGELIHYSADTAHLYEQAEGYVPASFVPQMLVEQRV